MKLSVTELKYLRTSLENQPMIRPDSRHATQFRPVASEIDVLPATNGSARVTTADGSECFVGIKVRTVSLPADIIDVSVSIPDFSDSDSLILALTGVLRRTLYACPQLLSRLQLTPGYAFQLYADCVVLSSSSYPLGLISLALFQALRSTKLPKLRDDAAEAISMGSAEYIPQFNDDWAAAQPLCIDWMPPLSFIVLIVGENVLIDPTDSEQQVADAVLCITWKDDAVSSPTKFLSLDSSDYATPVSNDTVMAAYDLVQQCAPDIVTVLCT